MEEALAFLLALTLLTAFLLALVLGVVAFVRSRRLRGLTRRVEELERRLAQATAPQRAAGEAQAPAPPSRAEPATAQRVARAIPRAEAEAEEPPQAPRLAPSAPGGAARELPEAVAPPPAPRRAVKIDWERWVGVRGAAVVGGLLLALSGLLLVQYSIQRGWITPALRVALAAGAGATALGVSQLLHRRGYRHVSNALAGAGAVILYGALWAGRTLYGLFGFGWAFPGMLAVTVTSGWMALRRPSLVVAVFALVGGFVTPLLVSLGAERPLGLFGYLLVFDLGVVAATRRRRWGPLSLLASIGSLAVFAVFALRRLEPGDGPLALAFLGLSALVLALPALLAPREERGLPALLGASIALLGSFPLAFHVASRGELGRQLLPLALLAAALEALAGLVARRRRAPLLAVGAALGAVALTLAWVLSAPVEGARAWHLIAALALLVGVPHALLERSRRRGEPGTELAAPLAAIGLAGCVALAALDRGAPGPAAVLAASAVLTGALLRQAHLCGWSLLTGVVAVVPGALWLAFQLGRLDAPPETYLPLRAAWLAGPVSLVVLLAAHAFALRARPSSRAAWRVLTAAAAVTLLALVPQREELLPAPALSVGAGPQATLLAALALAALGAGGAAAAGSATGLLATALLAALVQALATWSPVATRGEAPGWWIVTLLATALALSLAPAAARWAGRERGPVRAVAALSSWLWLPALVTLFADHADPRWRAMPALMLASCSAAAWVQALRSSALSAAGAQRARSAARAAAAVSTLGLLSVALTLQLERGLGFVAPALAAAGAAWTYRRQSHPVLPWLVAALLCWTTLRLGVEVLLLADGHSDWPRTGLPVLHWGTYGWALPGAAALAASIALRRGEPGRGVTLGAPVSAVCGLVLLFLWVNLEVQNLFQDGPRLELVLAREPVRDAATSIAWGLYALGLLVAALRTRGAGLRWASLAFFLAALVKVFLVDLSNLEGLYRVASLAALAVALLAVSLLYQRFVFRREESDESDAATA